MMRLQNSRVLAIALGISFIAHALVAAAVHPRAVRAAPPPKPGRMAIVWIRTPKPPKPRPEPPRKAPAAHHATKPTVPRAPVARRVAASGPGRTIRARGDGPVADPGPAGPGTGIGPAVGNPPGAAGGPPADVATPGCAQPDREARTIDTVQLQAPEIAREQGLTGTAQVEVTLRPDGGVQSVAIYKSSGSTALDDAALAAARQTTYAAARRNCEPVPGSYLFTAEFD